MARKATGNVVWGDPDPSSPFPKGAWPIGVRVSMPGGKRELVPLKPEHVAGRTEAELAAIAQAVSDKKRAEAYVPTEVGEVWNEWYAERYLPLHEELGNRVAGHQGAWDRYIASFIGRKTPGQTTPDDIKAIRDNLTKLRQAGKISAKWAFNIWSAQVKAPLSRAFTDDDPKYGAVRVDRASANPALGIKPPVSLSDREEDERERQALEPAELLALLSCKDVPIVLRRLYAIAAYSGMSPSEFYGLFFADVRVDAQRPIFKVQRGRDMKTGEDGGTKNKQRVRAVPIHPVLRPLIHAMRDEIGDSEARLLDVGDHVRDVERFAALVKEHLKLAGVDRPELHDGTDTLLPFDVRSFRTTFATMARDAGYDSTWIDQWLGHKPKTTATKHYVKSTPHFEDAVLRTWPAGVVAPFPPLPADLLEEPASRFGGVLAFRQNRINESEALGCEGRDLNRSADVEFRAVTVREAPAALEEPSTSVNAASEPLRNATIGNPIESVLAEALTAATKAGRWDCVATLAAELRDRRLAREGVSVLAHERARRGKEGPR